MPMKASLSSREPPPFWVDLVGVSRPGWWLVTVWLYLAPTPGANDVKELVQSWTFWCGLLYVCFPLNIVTYGLNDLADQEMDMNNKRKGNWLFGPKGMDRDRLKRILAVGFLGYIIPLPLFAYLSSGKTESSVDFSRLLLYLLWLGFGVTVNISYNFQILGHLSENGPFETPLVYMGYGSVTAFSYWLNVAPSNMTSTTEAIFGTRGEAGVLFGCNQHYWIHLAFLIARTQLWTEYMDYEGDKEFRRSTTLVRLGSKAWAQRLVLSVLLVEILWNGSRFLADPDWRAPFFFALMGPLLFIGAEAIQSKLQDRGKASTAPLLLIGALQTSGGLFLLLDSWRLGIFVA